MSDSNGVLGYIHDGYTVPGYIQGVPRLYPSLRFEYRPMLTQARTVVYRKIQTLNDPNKEEEIAAKAIKAQVANWDLKDEKEVGVPLEIEHILRVQPTLFRRIFEIVAGSAAPDQLPFTEDVAVGTKASEAQLEAALAGQAPEVTEEGN